MHAAAPGHCRFSPAARPPARARPYHSRGSGGPPPTRDRIICPVSRVSGSRRQPLAHEEFRVPGRIIFQGREDLVSELFVERARLKAGRLQRRGKAASFNGIFFRRVEQASTIAVTAYGRGYPEMGYMQPPTPDVAKQSAQPFAAAAFQEKAHRVPALLACRRDVVRAKRLRYEPAQ